MMRHEDICKHAWRKYSQTFHPDATGTTQTKRTQVSCGICNELLYSYEQIDIPICGHDAREAGRK